MTSARASSRGGQASGQRGAIAVQMALLLTVLGGMGALVLNVGHMMTVRGQLQNAVDAGALAGAIDIDGTAGAFGNIRQAAQDFTQLHKSDGQDVLVDLNDGTNNDPDGDIVLGTWDLSSATPVFIAWEPGDPASRVNAVLVRSGRTEARQNPLEVFFSVFLSQETVSVPAEAVAVRGGPGTGCSVPLVFADCQIIDPATGGVRCNETLEFSSAQMDNVGFTNLTHGVSSVNPPDIIDILNDEDACLDASVGDSIGVGNGNNLTRNVATAFDPLVTHEGEPEKRVTVPVIAPPDCPNPQFNQNHPVIGFVTVIIRDIGASPDKRLRIAIACGEDEGGRTRGVGGVNLGTPAQWSQLVR